MLNIRTEKQETALCVALEGRLDTTTAPELDKKLKDELGEAATLIFDMKELSYISSAGLRVLLSAQKIMNRQGSMIVKNVPEVIMEIFDVTGFCDILTIEKA